MIHLENVDFSYTGVQKELQGFSLDISKGEIVCLCGPSGCGKTTVTRLINGVIPTFFEGELNGAIRIRDDFTESSSIYELSYHVGSVFQNPCTQFFCLNTTSELAFACENQGRDPLEIKERISNVTDSLKMKHLLNRNIFQLSGGQKQLLACAATSIGDNEIFVLDEPSSNLDMQTIKQLREILLYWKQQGKTIVIAEHRLHYLIDVVDRFICMDQGEILKEFSNREMKELSSTDVENLELRPVNLTQEIKKTREITQAKETTEIQLHHFVYRYPKTTDKIIDIERLTIQRQQITAIVGHNGAGKTTFARCLCGLEKKFAGSLLMDGKLYTKKQLQLLTYMVLQDVNHQLFTEGVREEILLGNPQLDSTTLHTLLEQLNLLELAERHPLSLSGGQQQRVAIASALASHKEIVIFDEPTSGLDLRHMKKVVATLEQLKQAGKTIFLISHDYELLMNCADSVIEMSQGKVVDQYEVTALTSQKLTDFFTK